MSSIDWIFTYESPTYGATYPLKCPLKIIEGKSAYDIRAYSKRLRRKNWFLASQVGILVQFLYSESQR